MAVKKTLTAEQKKSLADFRGRIGGTDETKLKRHKDFLAARKAIRKSLQSQPNTVPALAESLQLPANEVLRHIAGMRKYGEVRELGEADGYIRYGPIEAEPQKKT
ncbi:MAG: hypothetical protein ACP5I8_01775 [Phycisphaerae bacterium]